MKKVVLRVEGMTCSACQNRVEKYLNKQDGVEASVNLVMAQALINYDEKKVSLKDLNRFIKESGYKSLGIYKGEEEKKDRSIYLVILFGLLVLIVMYISMSHMFNLPNINLLHSKSTILLLTILFLIYGFDIIKSGIIKALHFNPNMDTLVTLGIISTFIYSLYNLIYTEDGHLYFESITMIIYFVKLGRFIDKKSKEKTKEAIKELVQITPKSAIIKTDDGEKEVTIDEVKKGDILICRPGDKVAVDGVILKGKAHLDEKFITGESVPKEKSTNETVIAGSINLDGYIEYKAEKIGPESTISEIVRLVTEAANTKAPIARIADVVASFFTPVVIFIAITTFLINIYFTNDLNLALTRFVTVLVVSCPCALGLATPLAIVVSIGRCAKEGILIRQSSSLEIAKKIDTIVFDKTGTLTYGKLDISKINNYSKLKDEELLKIVATIEKNSNHPISQVFKKYKTYEITDFVNLSGMGLSGTINNKSYYVGSNKILSKLQINNPYKQEEYLLSKAGNSIIYIVEDKVIIGLIGVKDTIRSNAKSVISKLKKLNKQVILLTGDNEETASLVGKELEIDNIISNVLPADKEKIIKNLREENHIVMMVGDGINDAPSLATADIGVSVSSGTDIAANSSDIILMHDDLKKIIELSTISTKTIKIIKQNLFWAFIYNIVMIPIAAGLIKVISITPMIASISMTISSLTVVLNSLRLKK